MDIVKIQSLIKDKKTVHIRDIDTKNSYIQIGVYQTGNRKNSAGNADSYSPYAIRIAEITYITSFTTVGDGGASTIIGGNLNIPVYQTMIPHLGFDNTNQTIWNSGPGGDASNLSFGYDAYSNTSGTGTFNTAFGAFALSYNTTGNNNTAIGSGASTYNSSGIGNTAVGTRALFTNVYGSKNVAIGTEALEQATNAYDNTAIGYQALRYTTTGAYNVAIGTSAGTNNTTGSDNVFIGNGAGLGNTVGNQNTIIGYNASTGNFTGSVVLGSAAAATGNNQFVVGSSSVNAGNVTLFPGTVSNGYWEVIINGVVRRILLG